MANQVFVNQTADFLTFPSNPEKFGDYARPPEAPPHGEVSVSEQYLTDLSFAMKTKLKDLLDRGLFKVKKQPQKAATK